MKRKSITIVLTILILVVPVAIMPSTDNYYNIQKVIAVLSCLIDNKIINKNS